MSFALERVGFQHLADEYAAVATDGSSTVLTVAWVDGSEKAVLDYGGIAPPEFWLLTEVLDVLAERITWQSEGG